jgi:tRNA pseudouridine38-40 synthase
VSHSKLKKLTPNAEQPVAKPKSAANLNSTDNLKSTTQRVALGVEYDGSPYSGWQKQAAPELPTVQSALENSLGKIADHELSVVCAGRTDKGVHACCQVIHFDSKNLRETKAWVTGTNSLLPPAIRVLWAKPVSDGFHARFSALSRRYIYVITNQAVGSAILAHKVTHIHAKLDVAAMHEAAQYLLGENDFSAFRAAGCQSNSPCRNVHFLQVKPHGAYILLDIQANAFLQHMVRNIAGMLLEVGRGERAPEWAEELLVGKNRCAAGVTASPHGLYLVHVSYPADFKLPETTVGPSFLQP